MRRIIAEDPDWFVNISIRFVTLQIINNVIIFFYFYPRSLATVPLLTELCVKHIVGNFEGKLEDNNFLVSSPLSKHHPRLSFVAPLTALIIRKASISKSTHTRDVG